MEDDEVNSKVWYYEAGSIWAGMDIPINTYLGDILGRWYDINAAHIDFNTPGILALSPWVIDGREIPNSLAWMERDMYELSNCTLCADMDRVQLGVITTRNIRYGERLAFWL